MEIIVLGAGTAVPSPNRSPAGVLVRREGTDFLFDIGPGTVSRMAMHGSDPFALQHLLLTHLHSDHTLDLVTLLQNLNSTPERTRQEPLYLTGCHGTKQFYDGLCQVFPDIIPETFKLHLREVGQERIEVEGLVLSAIYSGHTATSLCYRLETPEGDVVYTGDCAASTRLTEFCIGADLLICECSFPSGWKTSTHMNADEVGKLAAQAGVRHLVATHLYPPAIRADIAAQIGRHYHGRVSIAVDGSTFTLPTEGER